MKSKSKYWLIRVLSICSYMTWSRTGILVPHLHRKNMLHGGNGSFYFCLQDSLRKRLGQLKKAEEKYRNSSECKRTVKGDPGSQFYSKNSWSLFLPNQTTAWLRDFMILWYIAFVQLVFEEGSDSICTNTGHKSYPNNCVSKTCVLHHKINFKMHGAWF